MSEVNSKKEFSLPIGDGGKQRTFSSFVDYKEFLEDEVKKWEWLKDYNGRCLGLVRSIGMPFLKHQFNLVNSGLDELRVITELVAFSSKYTPIYSFTPEGQFVIQVREKHSEPVAAMVMFFLTNKRGMDDASPSVKNEMNANPDVVALASYLSFDFKFGARANGQSKAYSESLDDAHQHYMAQAEKMMSEVTDVIESTRQMKQEEERKLEKQRTQQKSRFKQTMSRYFFLAKKTKEKLQQQYDAAKADVENAKQTYHEKIDLEYSVNYWKERRRSHAWDRFWWGIGIFSALVATFSSMLVYYLYGGISGIVKRAGGNLAQHSTLDGQITEAFVADIAGAALLLTLLAVLVRLALRQFNIFTQLHIEAAERVTMVKTYLALLNEGKLIADQDRRLALESLFRSSQLTPAVDSGFNTPVDMMIKTLAERVGK